MNLRFSIFDRTTRREYVTPAVAARLLDSSPSSVTRRVKTGKLAAMLQRNGRTLIELGQIETQLDDERRATKRYKTLPENSAGAPN